MPSLLVLDMSYTYEAIVQRKLQHSVICRDLGGFFDHVWTVHPFATLLTSPEWTPRFGRPVVHEVNATNSFIEGKLGRFAALRHLMPLNFLISQTSLVLQLVRLIRREKIGVIRVGDPHYLGLMGWLLARLTGAKLAIRVCANYDANRERSGKPMQPRLFRSKRLEKLVERFLFRRFDLIAGANENNLEYAIANGAPPERSTVFRYGNLIDGAHLTDPRDRDFDPEELASLGIKPGRFLVSVARLEDVNGLKRPIDVVDALADLRAAGHDVQSLVVGEGPLRPMLKELVRERGLAEHVVFAGPRDQKWLARNLPHAAVFVAPHAGRALSEAAFAEVPAVGYDIDWQREMIIDGETGFLVPFGDKHALTAAVGRLLSDPALARRFGKALAARARKMLDPAMLDDHERAVYRRLLSPEGFRADAV